jgi:hypothetical protein
MQLIVNTTIEKEVFSMWFAYIHCWTTDVFSRDQRRDYISTPVVNQRSVVEREREWRQTSTVTEQGSVEDWLWLRETVEESVNTPNHPIQNALLLVTEP